MIKEHSREETKIKWQSDQDNVKVENSERKWYDSRKSKIL